MQVSGIFYRPISKKRSKSMSKSRSPTCRQSKSRSKSRSPTCRQIKSRSKSTNKSAFWSKSWSDFDLPNSADQKSIGNSFQFFTNKISLWADNFNICDVIFEHISQVKSENPGMNFLVVDLIFVQSSGFHYLPPIGILLFVSFLSISIPILDR